MSTPAPLLSSVFQEYESQRHLRLLRVIAPLFYIVESISLLALTVVLISLAFQGQFNASTNFSLRVSFTIGIIINVCYGLAWYMTSRAREASATWIIIGSTTLAFTVTCITESRSQGLIPLVLALLAGYLVTIALAGVLGDRLLLIIITVVSIAGSVVTVLIGQSVSNANANANLVVPPPNGLLPPPMAVVTPQPVQFLSALIFFVIADIGMMVVFFGVQLSSRASVNDLQELRLANEQARQLDELKDQFISNVNHELRNPIMGIMGHLDNMVQAPTTTPIERYRHNAERALNAAFNLRHLVDSILDANRIILSPEEFSPVPVNVRPTVFAAMQLIDPADGHIADRPLQLDLPDRFVIRGDAVYLQQILMNLLSNAIKYSPAGSPISVVGRLIEPGATFGKRQNASFVTGGALTAEIVVSDRGFGIPPEQAPLLFHRFVRLPRDLASNVIGNGLGLFLCRQLTEAMGGRIWVESTGIVGEGSAFHITLPALSASEADFADTAPRRSPPRSRAGISAFRTAHPPLPLLASS